MADEGATAWTRRDALTLGLTALGVLPVLAACAGDDDTAPTTIAGTTTTSTGATTGPPGPPAAPEELPVLPVHAADGDVLEITLTPAPATVDIGAAQPITTFAYDGAIPGAVWSLRPGQTLRVHLVNQLPPLDHATMEMDRPHEWTTTNLHTHGLHVSPVGDGDNPFVTIEPGADHHYEIEIPKDHTGGLFWYHPHRHGGVAQQIRGGMAGAIVVRGPIDEVPEVAAATERIVVIQGIELDDQFHVPAPIPDPTKTEAFFPRSQILYPINGRVAPTLTMRPGEVQRWRILNAAEGKFMDLVIPGVELHVLAWDGLTLPAPEVVPNLFMSPGNRVDVLVKATAAGRHDVQLTPSSSQKPGSEGVPSSTSSTLPAELETRTIATVVVDGAPMDMAVPTRLPAFDLEILPIARRREVTYSVERAGLEFDDVRGGRGVVRADRGAVPGPPRHGRGVDRRSTASTTSCPSTPTCSTSTSTRSRSRRSTASRSIGRCGGTPSSSPARPVTRSRSRRTSSTSPAGSSTTATSPATRTWG